MNPKDLSQQELARISFLSRRSFGNFIDGEFRESRSGKRIDVIDPASEMIVADTPDSDQGDVDAAVAAARRALEDSAWSRMRPADRERALFRLSQLIDEHGDERLRTDVPNNPTHALHLLPARGTSGGRPIGLRSLTGPRDGQGVWWHILRDR